MKSTKALCIAGSLAAIAILTVVTAACPANAVHKINQVNNEISTALGELVSQADSLHSQGTIDSEETIAIANFAFEASKDQKILTGQLRAFNNQPANVDQVLAYVQQFADSIHKIDLHVKSQKAQAIVTIFFSTFEAAISTLRATIAGIKTSAIPSREPLRAGMDPVTEVELALAAFTSISKLLTSWFVTGKFSDQQLQDATDAADDDVTKAALALIAKSK